MSSDRRVARSRQKKTIEPGPFTIAMTRDVLVIEIPLTTSRYPSRNDEQQGGARYSRKTDAYRALFTTVCAAAEAAVASGWIAITTPCDFTVIRVCADWRVRDAMNLGGCEANALTRGGAWSDDACGAPAHVDVQVDESGMDRIILILRRQYPRSDAPRAARPIGVKQTRGRRRDAVSAMNGEIGFGEVDGRPMTKAEREHILGRWRRAR